MTTAHQLWVNKKDARINLLRNLRWNCPHRLATIATSGTLDLYVDERDFAPALTGTHYRHRFEIDFSLCLPFTRTLLEKEPFAAYNSALLPDRSLALYHRPYAAFWRMEPITGTIPADTTVLGTLTTQEYYRINSGDPWSLVSTTTHDITGYFSISWSSGTGGDPVSGGKGSGADDEKATFFFNLDLSAALVSFYIPSYSLILGRLPWVDPWASETSAFATYFTDWLADQNTAYGGGFTGTQSLSLDFT